LAGQVLAQETAKPSMAPGKLILNARRQLANLAAGPYEAVSSAIAWDGAQTALIVCDMWQRHWCKGACERGAEMVPRMNAVMAAARAKGVLIVHAPSGGMGFYKDHPARLRAQRAPTAANLPKDVGSGCGEMNPQETATYPVDHSDGGCDDEPQCGQNRPMDLHEAPGLVIEDGDAITDSGVELWNLMEQRGLKNVILMGVHLNMCVSGRPFGLRQLVKHGRNTVVMRDLTDTMYNSRRRPQVNHFQGTSLVAEHIEKFICPSIVSTDLTGLPEFHFQKDPRKHAVLIIGEDHYYTASDALRWLAAEIEYRQGLRCTTLDINAAPLKADLSPLQSADLAVLFARRRPLSKTSMQCLRDYLAAGKPLIAFKTTSHAFAPDNKEVGDGAVWPAFDREVLGCTYRGYPLGETRARLVPEAKDHPILQGLEGPYPVRETMYLSRPLAPGCQVLLMGSCVDGDGEDPRYRKKAGENIPDEPVAWTTAYRGGKVFYTSIGDGQVSFKQPWFRRLVLNAVAWALTAEPSKP
jgi:nicotinamidase-related amidase/type 1 glutamine amidotransferase